MNFNPCFLIPIYNHWKSIRKTVESLSEYALNIYVVDDGSDEKTVSVLASLARDFPSVRLLRLPVNQGKGVAVIYGMREALRAGFSHALQIDADGQHDIGDVPRFLELGAKNPEALICGQPIYDESVPKARLYGRYATHFWVCVETLSFKIQDSMCGFRLYPLAAACRLAERVNLPKRMSFDIEILVRLRWEGVALLNVPTRVIYPPDGTSHFSMLRDNFLISWMHSRLFFGMLFRLPILLWKKFSGGKARHWSELAERGGTLGLMTLLACYRFLGERATSIMLYFVVGYFFITGKQAREASLDYLRRINAYAGGNLPVPGLRASFNHMLSFGYSGLDRLAAWTGKKFDGRLDFPDRAEFERIAASGRGAVFIGSHLGNLELPRALATNERITVNAVVYTNHAKRFNTIFKRVNPDFDLNLVQVSQFGPDTAILLKEKIERGELVVIVGDRTPPFDEGNTRVDLIDFLGKPAPFAQGPFILASLLNCPVYLLFCLRNEKNFRIYLERFAEKIELPRKERQARLRSYMQRYAKRLEHYCLLAPDQWFNFYDFWQLRSPGKNLPGRKSVNEYSESV